MKKDKVVVLFSGGLDSTVLLTRCVKTFGAANVIALNMFYGQRHIREVQSAEMIADSFGVRLIQHDITPVFAFSDSAMLAKGKEVLDGTYAEQQEQEGAKDAQGQVNTFVPFRNGLFLSIATAVAYSLGANIVAYGAHHDDYADEAYPDCSEKFVDLMDNAIFEGTGRAVTVWAPFIQLNKTQIVAEGLSRKAPLGISWSCYKGSAYSCGTCATCIDREKAFENNGTEDPRAIERKRAKA